MTTNTPVAVTNNLSQELNNLRLEFETNETVRANRNQEAVIRATDHFLDTLVRSDEAIKQFETNAREAASFGKKLVQLVTWSGRGPTYLNQTLSELLDFGDLCSRLQDYFDTAYGPDEFRVFHYPIRNTRTTALTVSWDKAGFENADGIIRSNRVRAQQRLEGRGDPVPSSENDHDHDHPQPRDQRPRRREHFDDNTGAQTANRGPWQPRNPRRDQANEFRRNEPAEFPPRRDQPAAEFQPRRNDPRRHNDSAFPQTTEFQPRRSPRFEARNAQPDRDAVAAVPQEAPRNTFRQRRPVSAAAVNY